MPMFLIERNFAQQLEVTADAAAAVKRVNEEVGVHWLYSFLSADKKKTYCLYEAVSAEAIRDAARQAGLPADVIVELGSQIHPEQLV
jgi:Nickel responsive protein SCO4226-like